MAQVPPLQLLRAAQADLEEIRLYTETAWGEAKWLEYFADLLECFERIRSTPNAGTPRDMFTAGLRSVPCREHLVFYLAESNGPVVVQRILHAKRNASALKWVVGEVS